MNAAAWIALASVTAFCVVQSVIFAFSFGRLFERVRALEARKDGSDCTAAIAAMEATIRELKSAFEQRFSSLELTVQNFVMPKATRRRAAGE